MRLLFTTPSANDRGPKFMERALAAIHQGYSTREVITFEYGDHDSRVGLLVQFPPVLEQIVTTPLFSSYPQCVVSPASEPDLPAGWKTWHVCLTLTPDLFPILRHTQFEDLANRTFADPIDGLLRAATPSQQLRCRIELSITHTSARKRRLAIEAVHRLNGPFLRHHHRLAHWYAVRITAAWTWPFAWCLGRFLGGPGEVSRSHVLETSTSRLHEREEDVQAASDKLSGHLFDCRIQLIVSGPADARALASERLQIMAGAFGAFSRSRLASFHASSMREGIERSRSGRSFLLSHEELATLFHPPTASVQAEKMQTTDFTELEPPAKFCSGAEPGAVTLGRIRFRGDERLVGMDQDGRRRHVYIVGATGAGKSTLLLNLIQADMRAGRGLTVFDVHGDLAEAVTHFVPPQRTNDVIVFDAAGDHVIPFNPLACSDPMRVDQVTSGVVSAFRKLFDSWGPRLENLLRYAVFATVEQGGTLLDLLKLLTDEAIRERMVARIRDDVVQSFWTNEFAGWNNQYRTEAVSSVTNKIMPFLTNRHLRAITASESKASLDVRQIMDREQILVVNISRGRLGQDNATLLGSLLLTSLEQAAMSRADIPEGDRRDHFLYLDEFQSLTTPSTAIMLSESRKYRLCLTLSHQLMQQLDDATWHAVLGNVGTMVAFRVGSEDAALLAPALSKFPGQLKPEDLANLPNYTAFVRLLVDGMPSKPFSMGTLPPPVAESDRREIVMRVSQRRHTGQIAA
jgi:hypothetical protein